MTPAEALTRAFADEWGRVVASLVRITGDWALAEDAAQDAFTTAATVWARDGVPRSPGAWLTTVARNRALDGLRRGTAERSAILAEGTRMEGRTDVPLEPDDVPDDRLRLIFTCCHPALALEARVALTLRTLCGLTVEEIAHALGASEAATAKRLVRARQKIQRAGIPYRVPSGAALPGRLGGVLGVLYLLFTEGYAPSGGDAVVRPELSGEAIRLTTVLAGLMPDESEVLGLLALERFQDSRREARTAADGSLVPLDEQDRERWSPEAISAAEAALGAGERIAPEPGFYLLQARIAGHHARSRSSGRVDHAAIAREYATLRMMSASPHLAIAHAVAVGLADGPAAGLALLDGLVGLGSVLPAARADLLRRAGRDAEAAEAYRAALELVRTEPERRFLERRLREVSQMDRNRNGGLMDMKLELVVVPVADVDRAKAFYTEALGFVADVDVQPAPGVRVVQVTPPGSGCSIGFGSGLGAYDGQPGSVQHVHLVVADLDATRAELVARGVAVEPTYDVGGGVRYAGFQDPDGNGFLLQEMAWRTGDAF